MKSIPKFQAVWNKTKNVHTREFVYFIDSLSFKIHEILKHSEIKKEQAIEQLATLFEKVDMPNMDYDVCKQLIKGYLQDPFLTTKNIDLE
jgi:hypothetical protein